MNKLLPQANNLRLLIDVFIYASSASNWTLKDIADFCKFDSRQSSYYLNACVYLDLFNSDLSLSNTGKTIVKDPSKIRERIYEIIISDTLISKIFAKQLIEGIDSAKKYAISIISEEYPDYSITVIKRRTSTILNWCVEIEKYSKSSKHKLCIK